MSMDEFLKLRPSRKRCLLLQCFFFSSRRRHTRFDCDWSSDVCSSDLDSLYRLVEGIRLHRQIPGSRLVITGGAIFESLSSARVIADLALALGVESEARSGERRVGKECRSRWSPDH